MKVRQVVIRLALAFFVLLAILLATGYLGLSRMDQTNASLEHIIETQRVKVRLAREALNLSNINSRLTMEIFLLRDKNQIEEAQAERVQNSAGISVLVDKIEAQCESREERDLLDTIKRTRTQYVESYKYSLRLLVDEKKREAATAIMVGETLPRIRQYHAAWSAFLQFQTHQVDAAIVQNQLHYVRTRRLVLLLIGLAVAVAASIALFVTHDIGREMNNRILAEGEVSRLNQELEQRVAKRTEELAGAEEQARHSLADLREYTLRVEAVNQLIELLQSCLTVEEAHSQVARCLSRFFPSGTC